MLEFAPETHVYKLDGVVLPSVTGILQGVGLINFNGISVEVLAQASAFGTAVHLACALDDVGDLDEQSLDQNLKPYLEAWRAFRGAQVWDAIEQPLCHPAYRFAGTPDRISGNLIVDIKTGVMMPYVGLQLAGYGILADIPAARRLAVQLKSDGKYSIYEFKDRKDREIFLAALSVYNWRINHATT